MERPSEDFAVSMFAGPPFRFARSVHKVRRSSSFSDPMNPRLTDEPLLADR
jgi:hypothetical protein|tara:strand:- start:300 stop:452 length:153 start_codon:yes stop_codon:yes gene_type:complete